MKKLLITATLIGLSGCAIYPEKIVGNEKSVTIGNTTQFNIKESQNKADDHCKKYNRSAIPTIYGNNNTVYECR